MPNNAPPPSGIAVYLECPEGLYWSPEGLYWSPEGLYWSPEGFMACINDMFIKRIFGASCFGETLRKFMLLKHSSDAAESHWQQLPWQLGS
jgi:hypothetical protein